MGRILARPQIGDYRWREDATFALIIQYRQVVWLFRKTRSDGSGVYHIPPGLWLLKLYVVVTVSGSSPTAKPESAATVRRGTLARIDG